MNQSYYPVTVDNRAEWWENIEAKAEVVLPNLNFTAPRIAAIKADAAWALYCYRTLRNTYENFLPTVFAYANTVLSGGGGTDTDLPPAPVPPAWPAAPAAVIDRNIEARREDWVQEIKKAPGYSASIGEDLRIVAPVTPFDPASYIAELRDVFCPGPRMVSGKFRKARGNADGAVVRGRKTGTTQWVELGRFNASPFHASVPLASEAPESWEIQIQVFRRDAIFGMPSAIAEVLVKG